MKQVHLLISGFVQGVGFREFVRRQAKKVGVVGWVRNLSDNRVEVVAQGSEENLNKLIKICSKGHFFSEVKNVSIESQDVSEEFESFDKKPTE